MYELRRISLMNWNLIVLEDLEIIGTTALIGAVGVGKSTILDAIQTVLSGNQKSKLTLNRAAGVKTSKRSVLEYCLGHTEDTLAKGQTRPRCHTILVLTFRDEDLKHSVAIGIVLYAEEGALREETRHRFVAPGVDFSFAKFGDRTPEGDMVVESWEQVLKRVRDASGEAFMQTTHARAEHYIDTYLKTMRPGAASPNAAQFQKRFRNAIAFEEIANPTDFVRNFVLEEDPVDTDLLRSNLEIWDEIAKKIDDAEKKLAAARTQRQRFARYATHQFDHLENAFKIAWHQSRAESVEIDALTGRIGELSVQISHQEAKSETLRTRLEGERDARERKKDREREAGITDARALAEARLETARERRATEFRDLDNALRHAANLVQTRDLDHYLPAYARDAQDAAEELGAYRKGLNPDDPIPNEQFLQSLVRRIVKAAPAKEALAANMQGEIEALSRMRPEADELARRIRQRHESAPVLDPHVTRFMEKLFSNGISCSALPELVEIKEGMEDWIRAAEAALGPFREAVFVAPKDLPMAHQVLRSARMHGKQDLWRVRLVNTARISEGRNVREPKDDAIVSILETDDDLVRKFLDSQFGHVVMVETAEELRRHPSAIMKDGTQSQGLSLRVHEHRKPVLGQAAQAALRADLQYDHEHLVRDIEAKDALVKRMKHGERLFGVLEFFDMKDLAGHLESLRESHRIMDDLRGQRDREVSPEIKTLLDEISVHERNIEALEDEVDEIQTSTLPDLNKKKTGAEYQLEAHDKSKQEAERKLEQILIQDQGEPYVSFRKALRDFEHEARGRVIHVLKAHMEALPAQSADEHREKIRSLKDQQGQLVGLDKRMESNTKQIASFLDDYGEDMTIAGRSQAEILTWLVGLIFELEDNVLRRYRDRVEEVQARTREEVREMLVVRLSDKFKRAKEELRNLNKRLKKHRFEGLTYLFTWSVDPEMQGLYEMTQRVTRDPERAQAFLSEGGDPLLDEAVEQIREIFSGGLDSDKWDDYRQYFTYELRMTQDEVGDDLIEGQDDGDIRGVTFTGNLTNRVGKGSGGQKQTPYYVAIAASMAAAYYPGARHNADRGMGLVCFDEAFSKLDIVNTQSLLRFFRDLGLQVLVAAPEEKRTSLMEIMDTVVNISKLPGGTDLYFRTTAIGERAKAALMEANPERKGIEGFRADLDQTTNEAAE